MDRKAILSIGDLREFCIFPPKVSYSERVITLTDEVKRDIWEYI